MKTVTERPKRDRRAHPRISAPDSAQTTPQEGDIVVRRKQQEGALIYILHTVPAADKHQRLLPTRGEAIAEARALARRQQKRAWVTDEGDDFRLLEDFRVVTAIPDVLNRLAESFWKCRVSVGHPNKCNVCAASNG
jgi:hypothetical protein